MALITGDMLVGGVLETGDMIDTTPVFTSPNVATVNNWASSTFQVQVAPVDAVLSLLAPVVGVSLNASTKVVTFDFRGEPAGDRTFTLRATYGGITTDQAVTVGVDGRPVFFNEPSINVPAGVLTPIVIEAQDPEGGTITLSAVTMPNGLAFTPAAQPTTTANGLVYVGTISGNLVGGVHPVTIRATASNGGGQTDFNMTINAASVSNSRPVITSSGSLAVTQGQQGQRVLTATDANNDAISWTMNTLHAWITLVGNQLTAAPPVDLAPGPYQAVVTASDGALTANQTITVTVMAAPNTGVVPDSTPRERTIFVQRDGSVLYQPFFQDPLATMDYRVDLSRWLSPTDSVAQLVFSEESEMEIVAQNSDLNGGTVMLTAGEDRRQYVIVARAVTSQGRVHVLRFFVHVIAWAV